MSKINFFLFILCFSFTSLISQSESKYINKAKKIIDNYNGNKYYLLRDYSTKISKLNSKNSWGPLLLAHYYSWQLKYDSTYYYVEKSLLLDSNNVYAYLLRAHSRIIQSQISNIDCDTAIYDLEKALKIDSLNNYETYNKLGNYYVYCNYNFSKSKLAYDKSLSINKNQKFIYYERAHLKYLLNDTVGAIKDYNDAIKLDKNTYAFYEQRGFMLFLLHDYKSAYKDFNSSIKLGNQNCYDLRGATAYFLNKYNESIEDLTIQLNKYYNSYDVYSYHGGNILYYRGMSYFKINDIDLAINDWTESAKLGDGRAFNQLKSINKIPLSLFRDLYDQGKYELVIKYVTQLDISNKITDYLQNKETLSLLANSYYMQNNYDSSYFYYNKLLNFIPTDNQTKLFAGISAINIKKYEAADSLFNQIDSTNNDYNCMLYYYKGISCYFLNNDSSKYFFEKVINSSLINDFIDSYWYMGQISFSKKEYNESIKYFTKLIETGEIHNNENYYRGLMYYNLLDYQNAISDFSNEIKINPKEGVNYLYRGNCYRYLNLEEQACLDYKEAFKTIYIDDEEILNYCK
jgi:tetratricopeptide (TPR) repeat protein